MTFKPTVQFQPYFRKGQRTEKKNYPPAESMENQQEKRKGEEKQHMHQGKSCSKCSEVICSTWTARMFFLLANEGKCSSSAAPAWGAACPRTQEQAGHCRERAEGGLRGNTKLEVTVRKFKEHGEEQQDCVGGWWNREALWILWGRITKKGSERAVAGRGGHCRDTEDLAL